MWKKSRNEFRMRAGEENRSPARALGSSRRDEFFAAMPVGSRNFRVYTRKFRKVGGEQAFAVGRETRLMNPVSFVFGDCHVLIAPCM
jgi:hypothetical protein